MQRKHFAAYLPSHRCRHRQLCAHSSTVTKHGTAHRSIIARCHRSSNKQTQALEVDRTVRPRFLETVQPRVCDSVVFAQQMEDHRGECENRRHRASAVGKYAIDSMADRKDRQGVSGPRQFGADCGCVIQRPYLPSSDRETR